MLFTAFTNTSSLNALEGLGANVNVVLKHRREAAKHRRIDIARDFFRCFKLLVRSLSMLGLSTLRCLVYGSLSVINYIKNTNTMLCTFVTKGSEYNIEELITRAITVDNFQCVLGVRTTLHTKGILPNGRDGATRASNVSRIGIVSATLADDTE